jgi:hypothetical protein
MTSRASSGVVRGIVSGLGGDAITVVIDLHEEAREISCDLLDAALRPGDRLTVGDRILVWADAAAGRGVVVGRIVTPELEVTTEGPIARPPQADELILDATERITLRVGDGSIEIRGDGKILLKGTDLVSHAKRINRIKGGSVSIN